MYLNYQKGVDLGEEQSDLYSDIYKTILANFFELNDFILYNYPDIARRGYSEQGVDVAVIPNLYKWFGISASYAIAIKDIREDLLRKSVYYRGSFQSFQKEFEPLLSLYRELLGDINSSQGRLDVLLEFIRTFLLSLDEKFQTGNYFYFKLNHYFIEYSGKSLPFNLQHEFETFLKKQLQLREQNKIILPNFFVGIDVKDEENSPLANEVVKIYRQEKAHQKQLIDTVITNDLGVIGLKLQEGSYIAELEKYRLTNSFKLKWHSTITFTKPSFLLSAKVVDPDNKPIENIKIQISPTDTLNKKIRTIISDNFGNSTITIPTGNYRVEVKEYNLSKIFDISKNCNITFMLPRISIKVVDPDNKPISNLEIQISSTGANKKIKSIISSKYGNSVTTIPVGNYIIHLKKYNLSKFCDLSEGCSQDCYVTFTLPKKSWWQKY